MKRAWLLLLAACSPVAETPVAPSLTVGSPEARAYIVSLARGASPETIAHDAGVSPRFVYRHALTGFSATLSETAVEALRRNPQVRAVVLDGVVTVDAVASWGLDRIDQRTLPLNGSYVAPNNGSSVTAYIIDTGIVPELADFGGRAAIAVDVTGGDGRDCNFHGTHVAGTVGSNTYGVAKGVRLRAVKVFPLCSGSTATSSVIAGIDWITGHAVRPAVVNMSVGGPVDALMNEAVEASVASGLTYVVAAGNSSTNACLFSPAGAPSAITIGATTEADGRAAFSNDGSCVDLFAPGLNIPSLDLDGSERIASGTSMASPHAAGVAALYLHAYPQASGLDVQAALVAGSTRDVLSGVAGPNRLLWAASTDVGYPPPPLPPPPPPPPIPAAPTNLTAIIVEFYDANWASVYLQWQDNSDNELQFSIVGQNLTTGSGLSGWAIAPRAYISLQGGDWELEVAAQNAGGTSAPATTTLCVPLSGHQCGVVPPPPPPPCVPRGKSGKCK